MGVILRCKLATHYK